MRPLPGVKHPRDYKQKTKKKTTRENNNNDDNDCENEVHQKATEINTVRRNRITPMAKTKILCCLRSLSI